MKEWLLNWRDQKLRGISKENRENRERERKKIKRKRE